MKAMLNLERGTETATETLRRYAPLADEIDADGMDVEALELPSSPPATRLMADRTDQDLGWEGATHGTGLAPERTLEIEPAEADVVARLFVTVSATTIAGTVEAMEPWLARVEPAALSVDPGRAALLYLACGDLRTETEMLEAVPGQPPGLAGVVVGAGDR